MKENYFCIILGFIWNSTALTRKQWNVVFIVSFIYEYPLRINIQILASLKERTKMTISQQIFVTSVIVEKSRKKVKKLRPKTTIIPQLSDDHTLYLHKFNAEFWLDDNS